MRFARTATSRSRNIDALKAAWYCKYLYNRPSPSTVDPGVKALIPANDLPAYPSEDAVVAGVIGRDPEAAFPDDGRPDQRESGRTAAGGDAFRGRHRPSDLAAGLALGQAIAAIFIARARSDGMGAAAGTPAVLQALSDATAAKGEIPWHSLEIPPRPPMLPLFGNVKAWMMTPADIVNERPVRHHGPLRVRWRENWPK